MSFERPYEGLRVVDMSQGVAGPFCAMLLAQHGADVIKLEPHDGDWGRRISNIYGDHTSYSVAANMGKRSLALDLKRDESRGIVDRLLADADVFIEGFRPGVTDRLGYSWDRLHAMNPRLIYLSISGFGQVGPMRERPAMDPLLQAFTGFMAENTGADGIPHRTPVIINDMSTALFAHQAVAAALYHVRDTGEGRKIDVSLMESSAALQAIRLIDGVRDGPYSPVSAPSGTFETKDGFLQMIVVQDREWQRLCTALGWTEEAADPDLAKNSGRRAQAGRLMAKARAQLATQTTAHWQEILTAEGVQNERVQNYAEFVEHPQIKATDTIAWLPQAGSDKPWPVPNVPGGPRYREGEPYAVAPTIGQQSREILAGADYSEEEISRLFESGVVA